MLQRIKDLAAAIKDSILWIITPAAVAIASIFLLFQENRRLKTELKGQKATDDLREKTDAANAAETESNDEETKFNSAYDALVEHYNESVSSGEVRGATASGDVGGAAVPAGSASKGQNDRT